MPSAIELMVIAKHCHFHNISKVNQNKKAHTCSDLSRNDLCCHSILFQHDAPITASVALMFHKWMEHYHCPSPEGSTLQEPSGNKATKEIQDLVSKMITIQFVGPKGDIEMIGKKAKMKTPSTSKAVCCFPVACCSSTCASTIQR